MQTDRHSVFTACLYDLYISSFDSFQVLKVDESHTVMPYFVHYISWNKSWDEWISADAVVGHASTSASHQTSKCLAKVENSINSFSFFIAM